jgi:hypothetical protein
MKEQKWLKVLENSEKSKKDKIDKYASEDRLGGTKLKKISCVCVRHKDKFINAETPQHFSKKFTTSIVPLARNFCDLT